MTSMYSLVAVVARIPSGTSRDYVELDLGAIASVSWSMLTLSSSTGPLGPTGPTGGIGPQGPPGAPGLSGATGPQGDIGPPGLSGATGASGVTGASGATGADGAAGAQGIQGVPGPSGATGPQGPAGGGGGGGTRIPLVGPSGVNIVFTNMPSANSEPFGSRARVPVDLSSFTECRLWAHVIVAGAAASRLSAEWSTNLTSWTPVSTATGPGVAISAASFARSTWTTIRASARTRDIMVRLAGQGGDGTLDPAFGSVFLEVR